MTDSESGDSSGEDPEGNKVRLGCDAVLPLSEHSRMVDPGGGLALKTASFLARGQLGHIQNELAFSWQRCFWFSWLTSRQGLLA